MKGVGESPGTMQQDKVWEHPWPRVPGVVGNLCVNMVLYVHLLAQGPQAGTPTGTGRTGDDIPPCSEGTKAKDRLQAPSPSHQGSPWSLVVPAPGRPSRSAHLQ